MFNKKALFLDRDGVINKDHGYVFQKENFHFIDGIFDFVLEFQKRGFLIFVVTNQSGIARKYYTEKDFSEVTDFMISEFQKREIKITKVYHCPCHEDFPDERGHGKECKCRKPSPNMLFKAQKEFDVNLQESLIIGDKKSDIEAGQKANLKLNYLFLEQEEKKLNFDKIWDIYNSK
jgi:D-glycero-D-manno-heptose 1,7-bisphosphate phosphatase